MFYLFNGLRQALLTPSKQGITVLSECQAVSADLDQKYLKVKRISSGEDEQPLFGETIKVQGVVEALHDGSSRRQ